MQQRRPARCQLFADRSFAPCRGKYQFTRTRRWARWRYEGNRCGGQPDTGAGFKRQAIARSPCRRSASMTCSPPTASTSMPTCA